MMDFREATACLDEYRTSLANICGMIKPPVAKGELGEVIGKINNSLIEILNEQIKEAVILSVMIHEEMNTTKEQLVDFPGEWADVLVALNQLRLATDSGAEVRAEYFRKTAEANDVKDKGTQAGNPVSISIAEFKRSIGWQSDEEAQEEIDMLTKKAALILNTPNRIESCAPAEPDAPGDEAGTEIRIEPFESASPNAEISGEECGTRVDTMDDAETILNWLVDLDRTSLIAFLSDEAEVAQRVVLLGSKRTASAKHREAMDYLDRVNRILIFFRDGKITPGMSEHELSLCESFQEKMQVRSL
jgi:hypothetical protein